jgi:hypothetical protein
VEQLTQKIARQPRYKVLLEAARKKGYIEAGTQDDVGQRQFGYILYMERTTHGSVLKHDEK